jgi:fatty acid desaturase
MLINTMSNDQAIAQMRDLLDHPKFMQPNIYIFWRDLLACSLIGWSLVFIGSHDQYSMILYLVGVFFLYKGAMLVHEVSHLAKKIPYYRVAYNILLGYPNSYPAYIYDTHLFHHGKKTYGTKDDPEYAFIKDYNTFTLIKPLLIAFLLPFLQWLRFGILPFITPFLPLKAKRYIFTRYSTLVFDASYRRRIRNENKDLRTMIVQDFICALYKVALIVAIVKGVVPLQFIAYYYFAIVLASILNMYRALFNHYYANHSQESLSWEDHLRDTVTLEMGPVALLVFVNHLNYHALHHLFPEMPYHRLGVAHQTLMKELPKDHSYRTGTHKSLYSLVKAVLSPERYSVGQR